MKKFITVCVVILVVCIGLFSVFSYFNRHAIFEEIKKVAEKKISDVLRAHVSIDHVDFGVLNRISLSDFKISNQKKCQFFSLLDVKKIDFKLHPLSFVLKRLNVYNTVVIDSPKMKISFPENMAESISGKFSLPWQNMALVVKDGSMAYDFTRLGRTIAFDNINGKIRSAQNDMYSLMLSGDMQGVFTGGWDLKGLLNKSATDGELSVSLNAVQWELMPDFVVEDIDGVIQITRDVIFLDNVRFTFHDMPLSCTGTISDYRVSPVFDLVFSLDKYGLNESVRIIGDVAKKTCAVSFELFKKKYSFQGTYVYDADNALVYDAMLNNEYQVHAEMSLSDKKTDITVKNDLRTIEVDIVFDDEGAAVFLDLRHVEVFGFDAVFKGRIDLLLGTRLFAQHIPGIKGKITTEYCIFNYLPLRDFEGTIVFGRNGIEGVDFLWGDVYRLTGNMQFDELYTVNLKLDIQSFNIDEISSFSQHPLHIPLKGFMSGGINISGHAHNPAITGDLLLKDGMFSTLSYETAKIRFEGNKFILTLRDSVIEQGNRIFYMRGNIDFTKNNIFSNVAVQTGERVIIWRGWDVGTENNLNGVALSKHVTNNVILSAVTEKNDAQGEESYLSGNVNLTYDFGNAQALTLQAAEDDDEEIVALKHKMRF